MCTLRNAASLLGFIILVLAGNCQAVTQESQSSSFLGKLTGSNESFAELRRTRRELVATIDTMERDSRSADSEIEQLGKDLAESSYDQRRFEADLRATEAELISRKTPGAKPAPSRLSGEARSFEDYLKTIPTNEVERRKADIESRIQDLKAKLQRLTDLKAKQSVRKEELTKKQAQLVDVEERIGSLLNVSTNQYFYRTGVSFIFASIVFFLVLKFFRVVETDTNVKMSIFSGEAGIQFITLFSIVIAVILFGILEILGANELSALLGGLSGYILGKTGPNKATIPLNQNGGSNSPKDNQQLTKERGGGAAT